MPSFRSVTSVIARDGVPLHVESQGEGAPLVFVHEFGGDTTSWEGQIVAFSGRYRCVAFNARGYPPSGVPDDARAYSQAHARDDVVAVLDGLAIERAALVGLSMGSFAVLHVALGHPERVSALVVAGIGYGSPPADEPSFRQGAEANAALIEREGMAAFAEAYGLDPGRVQLQAKDPVASAAQRTRLAAHSAAGSAHTLRGVQARRPSLFGLERELAALTVPTLIVCGDEDTLAVETSLFLRRTIPSSSLAVLPRTGHLINLEEPAGFNALLAEFLSEAGVG